MKENYFSSGIRCDKKSVKNGLITRKNFRSIVRSMLLAGLPLTMAFGQTNPTPQNMPYTEGHFNSLTGTSPYNYPAGWQGWKLEGTIDDTYSASAIADISLARGNNNSSIAGIFDMVGKLGFISNTGTRTAPVLAVNATEYQQIKVSYDINVQRKVSDRVMGIQLQYRVGTTGNFTPIEESIITFDGSTLSTNNSGTDYLNGATVSKTIALPASVNHSEILQFRWVTARLQGGSGDNLGFSIDNVAVTGTTDPCANNPLPYFEDFTGQTTTTLPECTLVENVNNDTSTWKVLGSLSGFTGPLLRYTYHSTNAGNDWFFTKGLALETGKVYKLKYKLGTYNATSKEKLEIKIGNLQSAAGMTDLIFNHGEFSQGTPDYKEHFFSVGQNGNYYIGFHAYSDRNVWHINLDEIEVTETSGCLAPSDLAVSDVTPNSVRLSWDQSLSNPSEYEYYLSTTNTAPSDATTPTGTSTTTSKTITGLEPNTYYYVWVRSSCDATTKSEWKSFNFRSGLIPVSFPFVDDFSTPKWGIENFTALNKFKIGTPANGNITFSNEVLFVTNSEENSTYGYTLTDTNKTNVYAYVDVTLPADLTLAKIEFDWLAKGESLHDFGRFFIVPTSYTPDKDVHFEYTYNLSNSIYEFNGNPYRIANKNLINRLFLTDTNQVTSNAFNPTGAFDLVKTKFQDNSIDLSAVAGQTVRLLFVWRNDHSLGNQPPLAIDNFKFDYAPSCIAPATLTASDVNARTAKISWTASVSEPANGYEYYYSTTNEAPLNSFTGTATTELFANLEGLSPVTTYYTWVRSVCSTTDKSDWISLPTQFRTAISCAAPTTTAHTEITNNSAKLTWAPTTGDFEYYITTETTAPTASTAGVNVNGNTVVVDNLSPLTTYNWYVRQVCDVDDKSSWTAIKTFTTLQNPATFPYVDDFNSSQWILANGTQSNKFYIGTPNASNNVTYANNKLFVSQNGTTNTYSGTGSSIYAYRDITLPQDITLAKISFDWILKGEGDTGVNGSTYDYGRFYIVPTTVTPTAGTNLGYAENVTNAIYSLRNNTVPVNRRNYLLYNPTGTYSGAYEDIAHTYTDNEVNLSAYAGQTVRLVFFFRNDSDVFNPSLAIDNFEINYTTECITPIELNTTNISSTSATLKWVGTSTSYQYVITTTNEAPAENFVGTTSNTSEVIVNNLTPYTTYYWWVKGICEDSSTAWSANQSFTTDNLEVDFPFVDNFSTPKWNIKNFNSLNKFVIGTPVNSTITFADEALFVTNSPSNFAYNYTGADTPHSNSYAYIDVNLPADITTAEIQFDWLAKGEGAVDFGRFFIVPTSYTPNSSVDFTYSTTISNKIYEFGNNEYRTDYKNLINRLYITSTSTASSNAFNPTGSFDAIKSTYTDSEIDLSAYAGQTVRLLFIWRNDYSVANQPPLAIDNFYFGEPRNLSTDNLIKGDFMYYPNPVSNELNLKAEQNIATVEVYNLAGQAVNYAKVGQTAYKLDTTKLTSGVYLVKVAFENGTTKTVKIIKK